MVAIYEQFNPKGTEVHIKFASIGKGTVSQYEKKIISINICIK